MAEPTVLMSGLAIGESPRWHDGRLWFAHWVAQEIVALGLDGDSELVDRVAAFPFSIDWSLDGRMLIVSASQPPLVVRESDGTTRGYADLNEITEYPWNELVVDGRGNAYVNSIGFHMMRGEAPRPGLVAVVTPDGSARRVADGLEFPNGMAVTPDNATLIVAESYGRRLTAFDIAKDGSLSNRRVWVELGKGAPDGICIDAEGAVWYADVPNQRCVRVREGGEVLQTVEVDRGCFACMLGGPDGRTLFIMAAEWRGPEAMIEGARTGEVLYVNAPAAHAGFP